MVHKIKNPSTYVDIQSSIKATWAFRSSLILRVVWRYGRPRPKAEMVQKIVFQFLRDLKKKIKLLKIKVFLLPSFKRLKKIWAVQNFFYQLLINLKNFYSTFKNLKPCFIVLLNISKISRTNLVGFAPLTYRIYITWRRWYSATKFLILLGKWAIDCVIVESFLCSGLYHEKLYHFQSLFGF